MEGRDSMDTFASRLRSDRQRVGLTVQQLADGTGISFSYITKIETGRAGKGISPEIVTTLAKRLDCDVLEYLFLSDVVPAPLNVLLSNERSRSFLRRLLNSPMKASSWDRLQSILAESHESYSTSRSKAPSPVSDSQRTSVA